MISARWIVSAALCGSVLAAVPPVRAEDPPSPRYEMTTYVVGLLFRGPKWTPESTPETQKIQEGHMANIRKMAAAGKLAVAGPFSDDGDLRGIFIFQNATVEEARALADQDPAIQAGRLRLELHPWFAAKGLKVDPPK
jgi:uncharacterized protein YciI